MKTGTLKNIKTSLKYLIILGAGSIIGLFGKWLHDGVYDSLVDTPQEYVISVLSILGILASMLGAVFVFILICCLIGSLIHWVWSD